MAVTKLSDVIEPVVYMDYAREKSIYSSRLYKAGIVTTDPRIKAKLAGGAEKFEMPFWKSNDIIGASATPVQEDADLTPAAVGTAKMTARRHFREKAFGQNDLAAVLAGASPMDEFTNLVDAFWERNFNQVLFKSIQGVIADNAQNDSSDLITDLTSLSGDDAKIGSDAFIDTVGIFGDMDEEVAAIAMHSKCLAQLRKQNLTSFVPDNEQNINWETFLGKKVIVDDSLLVSTTYWSILFKAGAFAFEQDFNNYLAVEIERVPSKSGGQEILYLRRDFVMHPYGFAWLEGSVANNFPTDSELVMYANWNRVVADKKNSRFAVIKTLG